MNTTENWMEKIQSTYGVDEVQVDYLNQENFRIITTDGMEMTLKIADDITVIRGTGNNIYDQAMVESLELVRDHKKFYALVQNDYIVRIAREPFPSWNRHIYDVDINKAKDKMKAGLSWVKQFGNVK
jgi:hypothetical protein